MACILYYIYNHTNNYIIYNNNIHVQKGLNYNTVQKLHSIAQVTIIIEHYVIVYVHKLCMQQFKAFNHARLD